MGTGTGAALPAQPRQLSAETSALLHIPPELCLISLALPQMQPEHEAPVREDE